MTTEMMPQRTHIIAEMACSHDGSEELGRRIIDGAGQAGADSLQLQVWRADNVMVPHHPAMPTLRALELPAETWIRLTAYSRSQYPEMQLIGCVYDAEAIELCLEMSVDAFKIHSADLSNPHLIKTVAETNTRIDLSVGASTIDEVRQAVDWIRETSDSEIWLMYGHQLFPTPTQGIHLRFMKTLRDTFGLRVGYQDHTDPESPAAFWLPAAAVGLGVDVIEKHITHDRSKKGVDHEAALNPDEFACFVDMIRMIETAMGSADPRPFSDEEKEYRKYAKKSLVATRDIARGERLSASDLRPMRAPELGLPPDQAHRIVGRRAVGDIEAFQLVTEEDVE